jgi:GDPmannose 4,6-dehydratase
VTKRAVILGVGGMDGSHLADHLLAQGYSVVGVYRRSSVDNLSRIAHLQSTSSPAHLCDPTKLTLVQGDLTDTGCMASILAGVRPDELYNMADMDHVASSTHSPGYSLDVTGAAVGRLLEAVLRHSPNSRVFLPISALVFGRTPAPQVEDSPLDPLSPYACAKAMVLHLARYHREINKLWVTVGIFYNHDSVRRSPHYLAHELARKALAVVRGEGACLEVGNPRMLVSMGLAKEFVEHVHRVMQLSAPTDVCIGSHEAFSIGNLAAHALVTAGLKDTNPTHAVKTNHTLLRTGPQPTLFPRKHNLLERLTGRTVSGNALDVMTMLVDHYRKGATGG